MIKYLIKGTYTGNGHNGETFLLGKGGYLVTIPAKDEFFESKITAQRVATKYNNRNKFDCQLCNLIEPCHYEVYEYDYYKGDRKNENVMVNYLMCNEQIDMLKEIFNIPAEQKLQEYEIGELLDKLIDERYCLTI